MKIVVLDAYTLTRGDTSLAALADYGELVTWERSIGPEVLERAAAADIVITNKTRLSGDLITRCTKIKFISVLATGYDVVDVATANRLNIPVSNVPAYGTDAVAQHVIALLLELCQHVGEHSSSVLAGEWTKSKDWTFWKTRLVELNGLTLGIVGFGRIGQRVAELGRAFGMRILYSSRSEEHLYDLPAERVSIKRIFSESDVVSLHCNLSEANDSFVNRSLLQCMKPSAFLINSARGRLINELDLFEALNSGGLAGAALDVLSEEPPSDNHPLLKAPNCLITPHIAWGSLAARKRIIQMTLANIEAFQRGNPINVVNIGK
jgi:glycerate dehydrogenase